MDSAYLLPLLFLGLLGLAMLIYVVADGFDLGVGLWLPAAADAAERDTLIAAIGPFWDANETWLVLGVGLLLVAFPQAQGVVLGTLYLPVAAMLIGLILRGVAFDFRVKAQDRLKPLWNRVFFIGSALAALAQGWMLGRYVTGFATHWGALGFAALIALALPACYALLGACWLLLKTEGALQQRAARWARLALPGAAAGIVAISIATPLVSPAVFERWFSLPALLALAPVPLATAAAFLALHLLLARPTRLSGHLAGAPFALATLIVLIAFFGLAYSLFPWVVPGRIDAWQAAASTPALQVLALGAGLTVPVILGYTVWVYWVFRGKAGSLSYG